MIEQPSLDMIELFSGALQALKDQRERLNQADATNGNHGDHMVAIFEVAVQAARAEQAALTGQRSGVQGVGISAAMLQASRQLENLENNDSARLYGRGLALLAQRLQERTLELDDLAAYASSLLSAKEDQTETKPPASERELDVVKALLDALSDWERHETNRLKTPAEQQTQSGTDLGYLFGAGMAYLQAKAKGGDRLDILAETAVNASPLGRAAHRAESGRLVLRTLLQSLAGGSR